MQLHVLHQCIFMFTLKFHICPHQFRRVLCKHSTEVQWCSTGRLSKLKKAKVLYVQEYMIGSTICGKSDTATMSVNSNARGHAQPMCCPRTRLALDILIADHQISKKELNIVGLISIASVQILFYFILFYFIWCKS